MTVRDTTTPLFILLLCCCCAVDAMRRGMFLDRCVVHERCCTYRTYTSVCCKLDLWHFVWARARNRTTAFHSKINTIYINVCGVFIHRVCCHYTDNSLKIIFIILWRGKKSFKSTHIIYGLLVYVNVRVRNRFKTTFIVI